MPKDSSLIATDSSLADAKRAHEDHLNQAIDAELSDDQLVQLAEGADSWGAHCNSSSSCDT